jgi:hypothetical protein
MSLQPNDIIRYFQGMSVDLTEVQALELSKRASSREAAADYYFNNAALFDNLKNQPMPAAASMPAPVAPVHNSPERDNKNMPGIAHLTDTDPYTIQLLGVGVPLENVPILRQRFPNAEEAINYFFDMGGNLTNITMLPAPPPRTPPSASPAQPPKAASSSNSSAWASAAMSSTKTCPTCNRSKAVDNMYSLNRCSHFICYDCLCNHIQTAIISNNSLPRCPVTTCRKEIDYSEISQLADLGAGSRQLTEGRAREIKTKAGSIVQVLGMHPHTTFC